MSAGGRARIGVLVWLALLAAIAITGLLQDPVELEADGTTILRRFLRESGLEVSESGRPPDRGTFLLLLDARDSEQAEELLRWVEGGGRLVSTDPASFVADRLGVEVESGLGLVGAAELRAGCVTSVTGGVEPLVVGAADPLLTTSEGRAVACFRGPEGAYALAFRRGEGEAVVLGGPSFLLDDLIERGDNARFALQLLEAGGPVVFGHPTPEVAEQRSVWDLLPSPAKVGVLFAAFAAVLFAIARARRLGRPVLEEPVSPIPSSELVLATAGLYRRARAVGFAARLMRRSTADRLARRLGIPPGESVEELPETIARVGGIEPERVRHALAGPEPEEDEGLIALARELERVADELEGAGR